MPNPSHPDIRRQRIALVRRGVGDLTRQHPRIAIQEISRRQGIWLPAQIVEGFELRAGDKGDVAVYVPIGPNGENLGQVPRLQDPARRG